MDYTAAANNPAENIKNTSKTFLFFSVLITEIRSKPAFYKRPKRTLRVISWASPHLKNVLWFEDLNGRNMVPGLERGGRRALALGMGILGTREITPQQKKDRMSKREPLQKGK